MTEMSPLGTVTGMFLPQHRDLSDEEKLELTCKAGRVMFGVATKVVDPESGAELPRDGKTSGDLVVAGPWITRGYHKLEGSNLEEDGYFRTGDVATLDPNGYMAITDRSKDVIKSGGEWISSIDLENEAMGHPAVQEAAVIGLPHPKYTERPLLVVVLKQHRSLGARELLDWLGERVAKWWVPEAVVFVKDLPHTATGKVKKVRSNRQNKTGNRAAVEILCASLCEGIEARLSTHRIVCGCSFLPCVSLFLLFAPQVDLRTQYKDFKWPPSTHTQPIVSKL